MPIKFCSIIFGWGELKFREARWKQNSSANLYPVLWICMNQLPIQICTRRYYLKRNKLPLFPVGLSAQLWTPATSLKSILFLSPFPNVSVGYLEGRFSQDINRTWRICMQDRLFPERPSIFPQRRCLEYFSIENSRGYIFLYGKQIRWFCVRWFKIYSTVLYILSNSKYILLKIVQKLYQTNAPYITGDTKTAP